MWAREQLRPPHTVLQTHGRKDRVRSSPLGKDAGFTSAKFLSQEGWDEEELEHTADLNLRDPPRRTPLRQASSTWGHTNSVSLCSKLRIKHDSHLACLHFSACFCL